MNVGQNLNFGNSRLPNKDSIHCDLTYVALVYYEKIGLNLATTQFSLVCKGEKKCMDEYENSNNHPNKTGKQYCMDENVEKS